MATKKNIESAESEFELNFGVEKVEETEKVEKPKKAPEKKEPEKKAKEYDPEDTIPCRSLISGILFVIGERSRRTYEWADYGDVTEVEVRDLTFMIKSRNNVNIYGPRIIILDDEFVAQNKELDNFYTNVFKTKDLMDIVNLPLPQMKKEIEYLPDVAKESLKNILATMIHNHSLDSVQKIKALDEILGTQLILTLVQ